jgi:sestrin
LAQINTYLQRRLKSFIKRIVTRPESALPSDFMNMGVSLRASEKVHVALLAVQAKKQAELLYLLHAVMVLRA